MVTGNTVIYRPHLYEIETAAGVVWLTRTQAQFLDWMLEHPLVPHEQYVSWRGWKLERSSVRKLVQKLRSRGVPIDSHGTVGYRIGSNLIVKKQLPSRAPEALTAS